ncbi:MAG: group II intron reverse transcriptase/maturase [bacterium]|nr:group II intron reverse transcriptase/maturase [bacterium]
MGIPSLEDKIVQGAFSRILTAIYDTDFMDNSYGLRPGRNCHQALAYMDRSITAKPVNYIIDADIHSFFDNVDQTRLLELLGKRIADGKLLRYLVRFLRSGVMEEGKYYDTVKGTPQGGIISPILANIYLHYVLDLWLERTVKPSSQGYVEYVRYADDFIIMVQNQGEAHKLIEGLRRRLSRYGLNLSQEKTRLIQFGRKVKPRAVNKPLEREEGDHQILPGSFSFLGFCHYCSKTRKGKFKVGRKTESKRFARAIKSIKMLLVEHRCTRKLEYLWKTIGQKLVGHYSYYGVSGNYKQVANFLYRVEVLLFKWLNRRSQRRSMNWKQFALYKRLYPLPKPKIYCNLYSIMREQQ